MEYQSRMTQCVSFVDVKAKEYETTKRLPSLVQNVWVGFEITPGIVSELSCSASHLHSDIYLLTQKRKSWLHTVSPHTQKYHVILFDVKEKGNLKCK